MEPIDERNAEIAALKAALESFSKMAKELKKERDDAREKIERQSERIRYLEGATNHATGTPLSVAFRERDEARANVESLRQERDEAVAECKSLWSLVNANKLRAYKAERERDRLKEALEYIAHAGLSARHIEDYAKDFLRRKEAEK